jgi:hypothetical protein
MAASSPLQIPIDQVVCYVKRESPLDGAVFVSLNADRRMIPDSWLSLVELTDQARLLTLHYSAGTLRIHGHELRDLFDDACCCRLGEVRECGGPPRPQGLWITRFEWSFPIERDDMGSLAADIDKELK